MGGAYILGCGNLLKKNVNAIYLCLGFYIYLRRWCKDLYMYGGGSKVATPMCKTKLTFIHKSINQTAFYRVDCYLIYCVCVVYIFLFI